MTSHITRRDGVAAIICNPQGKILVGKRKGSHGAGTPPSTSIYTPI